MQTRYQDLNNAPVRGLRHQLSRVLPIAAIALAGYVAWIKRDQLGSMFEPLKGSVDTAKAPVSERFERVPDDYDWNRPSVANSTAMAGPVNGAGAPRGIDGGTMSTDLGTQGDGAR